MQLPSAWIPSVSDSSRRYADAARCSVRRQLPGSATPFLDPTWACAPRSHAYRLHETLGHAIALRAAYRGGHRLQTDLSSKQARLFSGIG